MNKLEFREFRKKYGLSIQDVAVITKSSVRAVTGWNTGQNNMPQSAVALLELHVENLTKNGAREVFTQEEKTEEKQTSLIGKRLSEYSEKQGISIKEFASLSDIGYNNTASLLKGSLPLGMQVLHKIKKAFPYINTEWVLFGNGEMEINTGPISVNNSKELEMLQQTNNLLIGALKDKEKTISSLENQIALMEKLQEVTKTEESPVKSHVAR